MKKKKTDISLGIINIFDFIGYIGKMFEAGLEQNRISSKYKFVGGDKRIKINRSQSMRIKDRDNDTCAKCGDGKKLEIDHKLDVSYGGTNDDDNLLTLCKDCNKYAPPFPEYYDLYLKYELKYDDSINLEITRIILEKIIKNPDILEEYKKLDEEDKLLCLTNTFFAGEKLAIINIAPWCITNRIFEKMKKSFRKHTD